MGSPLSRVTPFPISIFFPADLVCLDPESFFQVVNRRAAHPQYFRRPGNVVTALFQGFDHLLPVDLSPGIPAGGSRKARY